jgi:hypothetical protein
MCEKLNTRESSSYLGVSIYAINSMIHRKAILYSKENGRIYIKKSELDNYKNRNIKNTKSIFWKKQNDFTLERHKFIEMYKSGCSIKQISDKYSISCDIVRKEIKLADPNFKVDPYFYKLSEEEKISLRLAMEFYVENDKVSIEKTCEKFNITVPKFRTYLRRTGNRIRTNGEIRSTIKYADFFENINNELKAYLLGFFHADGHLELPKKDSSYCFKISVSVKDSHILTLYNNALCGGRAVIRVPESKGGKMAEFSVKSNQLGESLFKMGYDNRKTYTMQKFPNIREDLKPHFLRGFFDGDGSVSVDRLVLKNRLTGFNKRASFISYHKSILEIIKKKIQINSCTLEYRKGKGFENYNNNGCWILSIWNKEELIKVHTYLYSNANYYFKLKKDKFDLAILNTEQIEGSLQGNLY